MSNDTPESESDTNSDDDDNDNQFDQNNNNNESSNFQETSNNFTESNNNVTNLNDDDDDDAQQITIDIIDSTRSEKRRQVTGIPIYKSTVLQEVLDWIRNNDTSDDDTQYLGYVFCKFERHSNENENELEEEDDDELYGDVATNFEITRYPPETGIQQIFDQDSRFLTESGYHLKLYYDVFDVNIIDGQEASKIKIAGDFTVEYVLEKIKQDTQLGDLPSLTWNTTHLSDLKKKMSEYGITSEYAISNEEIELYSRYTITIEDEEIENLEVDILIEPHRTIKVLRDEYLNKTKRQIHENAIFSYNEQKLELDQQLQSYEIVNNTRVQYRVGLYYVTIYDTNQNIIQEIKRRRSKLNEQLNNNNDNNNISNNKKPFSGDLECIRLAVFDYMKLSDVKQKYARESKTPNQDDKFLSDEIQLEDDQFLYKLRIGDDEPLIIERETSEIPVNYICADCGANVKLSKQDVVQCRECFHPIVYKHRTRRVCQYDCR